MPDFPYDEPEEDQPQADPFKQLRNYSKKLERELKQEKEAREAVEAKLAERAHADRIAEVSATYGLTQRQSELLVRDNPDVELSTRLVQTWANELGIALALGAEEPEEEVSEDGEPIQPVTRSGSPPPSHRVSREQYEQLLVNNPREAAKAIAEGRVDGFNVTIDNNGAAVARF